MKRKYYMMFQLLLALLCSSTLPAQDDRYDAVYFSLTKEYTLNADGSMDYRYIKEQKLQSYRSFHSLYGESFIVYNPTFQKLKFNEVFTIMADGKKVKAPDNAFNEVLPSFAANSAAFNMLREMVVTHTGLERNATIHFDYTLHSAPGSFAVFGASELLAENEPVKNLVIRVKVPAGRKLYFQVFNAAFPPEITKEGAMEVYTWSLKDMAALSPEEYQPGGNTHFPRLLFSTSDSRAEVFEHLTRQPAFGYDATPVLKREVETMSATLKDPLPLVLKIQERVVGEIRLMAVPMRFMAYGVRPAAEVWTSGSGTALEKAVLMTTLMQSAGLDAKPFAVIRSGLLSDKAVTLGEIEDFGVRVALKEEGVLWLSATTLSSNSLAYILPGRSFITFGRDMKPEVKRQEDPVFHTRMIGTMMLSSDPILTGELTLALRGTAYPWFSLIRDKNRARNSITGSIAGSISETKESSLTRDALYQVYTLKTDHPFRADSNFYWFTLPSVSTGIDGWGIKSLSAKRDNPIELPATGNETLQLSITLPAGFSLYVGERKVSVNNKAGSFTLEAKQEDGKVVVKRNLKIDNRTFGRDLYPDAKELLDAWNNPRNRELIFIRSEK